MLLIVFFWSLLLLSAYIFVSSSLSVRQMRLPLPVIVLTALVVRLVPAMLLDTGAPFDIQSYEVVADTIRSGGEIYTADATVNRHPYLPLHLYWLTGARLLAEIVGLPYVKVVKLLPIIADTAIAGVIVWFLRRREETTQGGNDVPPLQTKNGTTMGMLYALNPIPIMICAYHGQFDAEPVLWMVLATACVVLSQGMGWRGGWGAGALLGLGILTKSYPVLAVPALLPNIKGWTNRVAFVAAMAAIPLLGVLLYGYLFDAPFRDVVARAIGYNFGVGIYGYTYFARLVREVGGDPRWLQGAVAYGRYITIALLALVWWIKARHENTLAALLTILVAFFAVTHAFAIQYLGWLVPVALMNRERRWMVAYTIASYFYMVVAYWGLIFAPNITAIMPLPQADYLLIMPASLPVWIVCIVWLWRRINLPASALQG